MIANTSSVSAKRDPTLITHNSFSDLCSFQIAVLIHTSRGRSADSPHPHTLSFLQNDRALAT